MIRSPQDAPVDILRKYPDAHVYQVYLLHMYKANTLKEELVRFVS
jgi:hypothetical protein